MPRIEKEQLRLPKTGEGNKSVEILKIEDGRVTMRILNVEVVFGYSVRHGKFKGITISKMKDAMVNDGSIHDLPNNLENSARRQAFAILKKQAEKKFPELRAKKQQLKRDPRQSDLF
jgi:hypothetical protein